MTPYTLMQVCIIAFLQPSILKTMYISFYLVLPAFGEQGF